MSITLKEAFEMIEKKVFPKETTETINTIDSLGYIIAEDIISLYDFPEFNRSSYDGYAINTRVDMSDASNFPMSFEIIDTVYAGGTSSAEIHPTEAVKVATGSMLPNGASYIIKCEDVTRDGERITIDHPVSKKSNVILRGEELKKGDLVVSNGTKIDSFILSVLMNVGIARVKVYAKPKILVLGTGDELMQAGDEKSPGKIFDSNLPYAVSRLKEWGYDSECIGIIPDDKEEIKKAIVSAARKNDLIITSGGMSVGDRDYLPVIMKELDADNAFDRVSVKPGGHVSLNRLGSTDVLSLSGNPFAFLAMSELLLRAVLIRLCHDSALTLHSIELALTEDIKNKHEVTNVKRGIISGNEFTPCQNQNSSTLGEFKHANGFLIMEPSSSFKKGEKVRVESFR